MRSRPTQTNDGSQQQNPLTRKLSDKQRFKQQKELSQELHGTYKKWLDQDVRWIITDQERKAFKSLSNDEERDAFIEQFWRRRNPDPDSPENAYREEHYRRIAYANEHFAAGKPGQFTDRGMIYITFGPPDSIESHPSGGLYERPIEEGGGETTTYPFEDLALPVYRGHRQQHRHRICGHLHVRRLPHDHRPRREGRASACSRCRPDPVRTDGHGQAVGTLPGRVGNAWHRALLRPAKVQGIRPAGAVRQIAGASGHQVQGPGVVYLQPQAASSGPSFLSMCGRIS